MPRMDSVLRTVCEDVHEFADRLAQFTVNPVQLTAGTLRIGFSTLGFEDIAVARLECNQQIADRLYMDPSWLLIVIQLTPQRWGLCEAPPYSLTLIAPGSDHRNLVFRGFRCVEVAVRVDLAESIGLGSWLQLGHGQATFNLPLEAARIGERWVTQLLQRPETDGLLRIDNATAAIREGCVDFLRWLRETVQPSVPPEGVRNTRLRIQRFELLQSALQIIDNTPIDHTHSVTELARVLGTTRRTLLTAFVDALGTPPSRYLLARRLQSARHSLRSGESLSVTDAALDQGFEHISRFSHHYRTLFGELPSHTLQRASRITDCKP